ncbi:hypothetical protein RMAECT_0677 [Rickettsia rhipicephali str. Ect]|uniref:Uncharacterized protein n=1 Tax=Rickettsia rhipicephali str. Ect TaxID=1359199 RepID=A0A0F3PFU7_RICRH|nr:hypothetical protein RMAECT_0677 [Rickettsia rhipicephali str. Ect]
MIFIPLASNLIYKNATATTFGSFLEVIDQLISGNIEPDNF